MFGLHYFFLYLRIVNHERQREIILGLAKRRSRCESIEAEMIFRQNTGTFYSQQ